FSSRRRHTRFSRDWSSDVCSSDLEVFNWGTFNEKVFRINPQGNNSLLTGANASGKSTYIDALLTLMVPTKKDRFYNQSSGVDKRSEERRVGKEWRARWE